MPKKTVSDDFKVFSERLSALMKEAKKKQEDLAKHLGIKRQTVSLYMNGQSMPDAAQVKNIAEYFNVSADWLLGLSTSRSRNPDISIIEDYTGLDIGAIEKLHKLVNKEEYSVAFEFVRNFLGGEIVDLDWFDHLSMLSILMSFCAGKEMSEFRKQMRIADDNVQEYQNIKIPFEQDKDEKNIEYTQFWEELFGNRPASQFVRIPLPDAAKFRRRQINSLIEDCFEQAIDDVKNAFGLKYGIEGYSYWGI